MPGYNAFLPSALKLIWGHIMVKIWHSEDLNLILGPIMAKIRGERDLNLILGCIVAKRRRRGGGETEIPSLRSGISYVSLIGTKPTIHSRRS